MMRRNLAAQCSASLGTGRTLIGSHRVVDIDETMLDAKVGGQMFA